MEKRCGSMQLIPQDVPLISISFLIRICTNNDGAERNSKITLKCVEPLINCLKYASVIYQVCCASNVNQKKLCLMKMLLILHKYKFLVNLLGLDFVNRNNRVKQFTGIGFMIVSASVITMSIGNFILNTENLNEEATNSIITIFACLMAFIYTSHVLINRVRFSSMENELQAIVNDSKC